MEKLSWHRSNRESVVTHSIKRNKCLHQVTISEHPDRVDIEITMTSKSFATMNFTMEGTVRMEANLYSGRMKITESFPKNKSITQVKRIAKLWHEKVKVYNL
jgi:hypothetical protein